MSVAISAGVNLTASDATGQQKYSISNFSKGAKIRDLIGALSSRMGLSTNDTQGRAVDYQAFNKSDGCHLRGDDSVGAVLRDGDEVSLLPDIHAGHAG